MNERIQELAKQCWDERPEGQLHFDNEKFAELIVKKCMDIAKWYTPDTEECEYTWLIHDKIEKYFGVEE
jgi:hypothetical protein